jgi:hypothetical protein
MVRAILDGRKTQTRRPIKPQPKGRGDYWDLYDGGPEWALWLRDNRMSEPRTWCCPYGAPGDRLWVRETHAIVTGHASDDYPKIHYKANMAEHDHDGLSVCPTPNGASHYAGPWRSSIHMFRWASRITLEVVSVRVERLQDITEEDARAEGITDGGCLSCGMPEPCGCSAPKPCARDGFVGLWREIHGHDDWFRDPWVWVIEFRRVT